MNNRKLISITLLLLQAIAGSLFANENKSIDSTKKVEAEKKKDDKKKFNNVYCVNHSRWVLIDKVAAIPLDEICLPTDPIRTWNIE